MSPEEKLLMKIYGELRDLRAELTRRAGEAPKVVPKSDGNTVAVVRGPGWTRTIESGADVPSQLTAEEQALQAAQRSGKPSSREPMPGRSGVIR
jgi:hypothetical protein